MSVGAEVHRRISGVIDHSVFMADKMAAYMGETSAVRSED